MTLKMFRENILLGERGSGLRTRSGNVQDFDRIKKDCLASGSLFEDPEFAPSSQSLWGSKPPQFTAKWLRPHEMVSDPCMFVDGASRFDVIQGSVGNCWMVAAAANLTLNDELFNRVVPPDQSFNSSNYCGAFHFRIWKANRWIDVVVDDRLPTLNGNLLYMKSRSGNEFWSALLEKAYAKLHGSYEALSGGSACEAMEDFTGGVTEQIDLRSAPKNLFLMMVKAYERSSLMSCSIQVGDIPEERLSSGLVAGHAYSITAVKLVYIARLNGKMPLIRMRNPWGDTEWKGAWSDQSKEWSLVSQEDKESLGLTFDADGEFWMSQNDFIKHFHFLEICNLGPDALDEEVIHDKSKKKWQISTFEGSWVNGATAGGCRNYLSTFWINPQYMITLTDPDEDDDDNECTIIVALMQKNRRAQRTLGGGLFLTIGFALYEVSDPKSVPTPLDLNFFKYNQSSARSHTFINSREVTTRFKLKPGTYCIVPSTFEPGQTGDFLLRIFTEAKNDASEHDEKPDIIPPEPKVQVAEEDPDSEKGRQLRALFAKIAGEDMEVNCYELQKILSVVFKNELDASRKGSNKVGPDTIQNGVQGIETNAAPEQQAQDDCGSVIKVLRQCFTMCGGGNVSDGTNDGPPDTYGLIPVNELGGNQFSLDVCRSMVSLMDTDHSGKLGLDEFRQLWILIRMWRNVFSMYDRDNSGTLDTMELRTALHSAGYTINNKILTALVLRYGHNLQISFDDFIGSAVKLRTMIEQFKEKDTRHMGSAVFTIDEWLMATLYS